MDLQKQSSSDKFSEFFHGKQDIRQETEQFQNSFNFLNLNQSESESFTNFNAIRNINNNDNNDNNENDFDNDYNFTVNNTIQSPQNTNSKESSTFATTQKN